MEKSEYKAINLVSYNRD